jgi:hypothetical protein
VLIACGLAVAWGIRSTPASPAPESPRGSVPVRDVAAVSLVVLVASAQVFFLTSILPQVLPALGVPETRTLEVGGLLIFASGVAAAVGALGTTRLAELWPEARLLPALLVASSVLVAALAVASSVWSYGALRFLQMLAIAPVFPIVVARVAQHAGGQAIGVINSARIGAAFVGPVVATTVLAWAPPAVLYALLAAIGLGCLPAVAAAGRGTTRRRA